MCIIVKQITVNSLCYLTYITGEYFDKQQIVRKSDGKKVKSLLAKQLESFASSPNSAFIEYAKFDGKVWKHFFTVIQAVYIVELDLKYTFTLYLTYS